MKHLCFKLLFLPFYIVSSKAIMMRNEALISRMVSNFQKDNTVDVEATPRKKVENPNVLSLMQNVLCKNFPSIPCKMIVEDETLRTLIERSINQLKYKKLSLVKSTPSPAYHLTLFPTIDSEDLTNFLQVSDTGYYNKDKHDSKKRKHKKRLAKINTEGKEFKQSNIQKNDSQKSAIYSGHKKLRKFYPHKIKYNDKLETTPKVNYKDYSEEKFSMSLENPESNVERKRLTSNYRSEAVNSPVWRIDYMKHGEPTLNVFDYEPDRLKEKLVKTGPNVIVSDGLLEQTPRKDVLHPDVYIKKNYIRKNGLHMDSVGID